MTLSEKLTQLANEVKESNPNAAIVLNILNGALTSKVDHELAEICLRFGMQVLD